MEQKTFVIELVLDAPVQKVWEALTDKDEMKQWYFDLSDFRAESGFEFSFEGGSPQKTYIHLCKVIEAVPQQKLSHSWSYQGYEGYSVVTWELFPEGDKTRVKLMHEGLETFPKEPDFTASSFAAGWTHIVGTSLKEFVEKDA